MAGEARTTRRSEVLLQLLKDTTVAVKAGSPRSGTTGTVHTSASISSRTRSSLSAKQPLSGNSHILSDERSVDTNEESTSDKRKHLADEDQLWSILSGSTPPAKRTRSHRRESRVPIAEEGTKPSASQATTGGSGAQQATAQGEPEVDEGIDKLHEMSKTPIFKVYPSFKSSKTASKRQSRSIRAAGSIIFKTVSFSQPHSSSGLTSTCGIHTQDPSVSSQRTENAPTTLSPLPSTPRPFASSSQPASTQPTSVSPLKRPSSSSASYVPLSPTKSQPLPAPAATTSSPSKHTPKKSTEFWLLDGSVIIQVEDTVFRLYRALLAKKSPFFAKLFTANAPEHYDGHPLYTVTGVSAADFTALLRAEDVGIAMHDRAPPFPALAALLRAADALEFPSWRKFAAKHLGALVPPPALDVRLPRPVQTLTLARMCRLRAISKRALYELLRTPCFGQLPLPTIVPSRSPSPSLSQSIKHDILSNNKDSKQADDFVEVLDSDDELYADEDAEALERLSQADLLTLLSASHKAQTVWLRVVRAPPGPSVVPCPLEYLGDALAATQVSVRDACRAARVNADALWTTHVTRTRLHDEGLADPLCALDKLRVLDWRDWGFCVGCVEGRRELWEEERERLWRKMDLWFGLEGMKEDEPDRTG